MNKKVVFLIIILILFLILEFFLMNKENKQQPQVCFKDNCFNVELVTTLEEQKRGLMFREDLASDEGMLFVYDKEKELGFWMKNTLIPLDIIWINENKEVVFISRKAQPCQDENCPTIKPGIKAKYVLEINGGMAGKIDLNVGDKVIFDIK